MADPSGPSRTRRIAQAYAALLAVTWLGVSRWSSLGAPDAAPAASPAEQSFCAPPGRLLDAAGAARVLGALRVVAVTGHAPELPPDGPTWHGRASLYCGGHRAAESAVRVDGGRLVAAGLAGGFAADLDAGARAACRIRLDVERGRGPVLPVEPLASLSLVPGYDGLGVALGDRELLLDPDELLRAGLLAGHRPLPGVDVEAGLDFGGALRALALSAGVDGPTWQRTPHHLFRARYESWVDAVEPADRTGRALPVLRYHTPPPPLTRAALRAAADAAASYLLRHLRPDGRFDYLYDPIADQVIADGDDYSLPRHSGAAYVLAQAGALLARRDLVDGAGRALGWLREHTAPGCEAAGWACAAAPEDRVADLGSAALALLAATEYRRASGDQRLDSWARRLALFLRHMQRDNGDFRHLYDIESGRPDEQARLLYYSGEAAFALARYASDPGTTPEERRELAGRVDRALRWLAVDNYDYFAGGFFFGEEHWTCIAADEAWELVGPDSSRERWADFCEGFAAFLARSRFTEDEGPVSGQPDLLGAYGFTGLIAPHPTPVGSRSEALLSVYHLALRRGHGPAAEAIAEGLRASMRFLLSRQVRRADSWMMPDPQAADGGFWMSDVNPQIRIDFPQHSGSALLRAAGVPSLATDDAGSVPPASRAPE